MCFAPGTSTHVVPMTEYLKQMHLAYADAVPMTSNKGFDVLDVIRLIIRLPRRSLDRNDCGKNYE